MGFKVQVGRERDVSGRLITALQAKPSPLSPRQPLLASHPPYGEERRGGAGRQHGHRLLQWSPRQHSPFHHKEGVLHGHGVPAPGRSRLLRAQGARALQISLCPPYPPRVAAWGSRSLCALRAGCTGQPLVQHSMGNADQNQTLEPAPRLSPPPTPPGASGRLAPPPGSSASANHERHPPHHFRTHAHVTTAGPAPRWRVLGTLSHDPGGGALGAVKEGGSSFHLPLRIQGPELLIPSQERHSGVLGMH